MGNGTFLFIFDWILLVDFTIVDHKNCPFPHITTNETYIRYNWKIGISEELKDPKQSIVVQFRDSTILRVRFLAGFITLALFILIAARAVKTYVKMKSLSGICGNENDVAVTEKDEEDPSSDYVKV